MNQAGWREDIHAAAAKDGSPMTTKAAAARGEDPKARTATTAERTTDSRDSALMMFSEERHHDPVGRCPEVGRQA